MVRIKQGWQWIRSIARRRSLEAGLDENCDSTSTSRRGNSPAPA